VVLKMLRIINLLKLQQASPTEIKELHKSNKEDGETLYTTVMLQRCIIILLLRIYLCLGILW